MNTSSDLRVSARYPTRIGNKVKAKVALEIFVLGPQYGVLTGYFIVTIYIKKGPYCSEVAVVINETRLTLPLYYVNPEGECRGVHRGGLITEFVGKAARYTY